MTFDDGLVTICDVTNESEPGEQPVKKLTPVQRLHYAEETVGINRYYSAIKADQLIESVIVVPAEFMINTNQFAIIDDGTQYMIQMVQKDRDDNGLKILRLSLERNGESYEVDQPNV